MIPDFSAFSPSVLTGMEQAAQLAHQCSQSLLEPWTLLAGLCSYDGPNVCAYLENNGIDSGGTMENIGCLLNSQQSSSGNSGVAFSDDLLVMLGEAQKSRNLLGGGQVCLEDVLAQIIACQAMQQLLVRRTAVQPQTLAAVSSSPSHERAENRPVDTRQQRTYDSAEPRDPAKDDSSTGGTVKRFCTNMLQMAADRKYTRAIGREAELQRVITILTRKSKNNPVLVGEPGTGKTAIAEELANRLLEGNVPEEVRHLKLYCLDYTSVNSSEDPVGVMQAILEESASDPALVLFIDEVHMLMSNCNCSDNKIANLLKPAMARGEIKILGATTMDEYSQRIEKDPAFERRFQKVTVNEPTVEDAIHILVSVKKTFEEHHELTIPDEVAKAAVELSDRYITTRMLPDKAFDLIDEAAAQVRIDSDDRTSLEVNDVMKVVTAWTGIPVHEMSQDDLSRLQNIEEELHKSVIGQDKAVKTVSDAIKRSRMGFGDASKPIGSFLFLGTTGVGKTELCKAVAEFLFHDRDMIVRIDMSEYQQEYSVSRLFGAPPGYVGYEQGGQLTEAVRRKPYSVVLFDEIEKAHPKVFETLLQVLDDGRMTDGQGRVVDFKNTIIVMTSNMGQQHILQSLCGREVTDDNVSNCSQAVLQQLRMRVAPEFINRIDNIVMFMPLTEENIRDIAKLQLDKQIGKLAKQGIEVTFAPEVLDFIATEGYVPEYGARPVKRAVMDNIINPLTSSIIDGIVTKEQPISVEVADNRIIFRNDALTS